jgi:hypothetical protein
MTGTPSRLLTSRRSLVRAQYRPLRKCPQGRDFLFLEVVHRFPGLAQSTKGPQKGLTILSLLEGAFPGAPSYARCRVQPAGDRTRGTAAALGGRVLQLLHATAKGRFRTRGRYSAATVLGTAWDTADRCDGTLTRVRRGTVVVNDFARHKTVAVHAGHSYLAREPGR